MKDIPMLAESQLNSIAGISEAEVLFQELSEYLEPEDINQLKNVYFYSQSAHSGQFRESGEPYISHPLAVTGLLGRLHLDVETLTAALLHDVMEDAHVSKTEISNRFGESVAELVDGVSKLDKMEFRTHADAKAKNFHKMLLAMTQDVRVIFIKLADRLHNMQTLEVVGAEKQRRVARETMEIYAPIADRLGLNNIYQELQELSFYYLFPTRYKVLKKAIKITRSNRQEAIKEVLGAIKQCLEEAGIDAKISGREKQLYSVYKKMLEKHLAFSEILDIYGLRILVKDVSSCYATLGILHNLYKPIPGKFKDYIAIPKINNYQSLHSTLLGPYGAPIEIQIRTMDMHRISEVGVASHWLYKNLDTNPDDLRMQTSQWLKNLLEILSNSADSLESLENFRIDLFPREIYVCTPQGKILTLPRESTAVDFAYAVHTNIGDRCVAVKINGENAPLRTKLRSGDHVEIITALHAEPNSTWLTYVSTGKARSRIRHFLKTMHYEESIVLGRRLLNQALLSLKIDPKTIDIVQWERIARESGVNSEKELLADIAIGKYLPIIIARRLTLPGNIIPSEHLVNNPISILGTEGFAVQFAKCCRPIPGDSIVGFIKKSQGLIVHTHDCESIVKYRSNSDSWLDVMWGEETAKFFETGIKIIVINQRGVLAKLTTSIAKMGSNIDNVNIESDGAHTVINFTLQVSNRRHLATVIRDLKRIQEVVRINRIRG